MVGLKALRLGSGGEYRGMAGGLGHSEVGTLAEGRLGGRGVEE